MDSLYSDSNGDSGRMIASVRNSFSDKIKAERLAMKKFTMKTIIALLLLSCQLAGCGNPTQPQEAPAEEAEEQVVQETAETPEPEPDEEILEEADLGDPEQEEMLAPG